jgi:hypothetical protein
MAASSCAPAMRAIRHDRAVGQRCQVVRKYSIAWVRNGTDGRRMDRMRALTPVASRDAAWRRARSACVNGRVPAHDWLLSGSKAGDEERVLLSSKVAARYCDRATGSLWRERRR